MFVAVLIALAPFSVRVVTFPAPLPAELQHPIGGNGKTQMKTFGPRQIVWVVFTKVLVLLFLQYLD